MIQDPVLIVDDEAEVRASLTEALGVQGYAVEAVASGEEALARIAGRSYPVVITDLHMPGGFSGLELISAIRQRAPETVCVLITAFATLDTSIDALKRGAYDLIQKPFKLAEIEAVLNRALDHADLLHRLHQYQEELEARIHSRTRDLQEAHHEALILCDLTLGGLSAGTLTDALAPILDRLGARWGPDGLGCYLHQEDGGLDLVACRGRVALPRWLPRPAPGPLVAPQLGYPEEHLVPLGNTAWLYLGFVERSSFQDSDPAFLLLARHLELLLRVR